MGLGGDEQIKYRMECTSKQWREEEEEQFEETYAKDHSSRT